ncbi:MAG: DnaD domain protein [Dorea sp.]|jgi:DnaD/phage-associated family protein|nr:DnaD domain protein [Dorea sp.]
MKKLTLTNHIQSDTTVLKNEFIDKYMTKANGEYVKVYLLLLRHLNAPSGTLTISKIADILDHTEKDVIRALNYWKRQGLLEYENQPDAKAQTKAHPQAKPQAQTKSSASPETKPPASDVSDIRQYKSRKEFKELLFVAEQYLGKTLSGTDVDTITYFSDTLHMSTDLIEYLIEYCVENGHKSMHYIQKVALSWHERRITTVDEAKAGTLTYNRNCYSVLNAFGIKGRAPAASELTYIKRWNEEYGFSLDIIVEACSRTMNSIHQPNFDYAESILRNWSEKKVRRIEDIKALDAGFHKEKERKKKQTPKSIPSKTKFNNFEGRSYDMNELERKLIQQ